MDDLNQFLARFAPGDVSSQQFRNHPNQIQTFYTEGAITGAATWWMNVFHPQALYFDVIVQPEVSTALYENMLVSVIEQARIAGKPVLIFREQSPGTPFGQWLATAGFEVVRQTTMPLLTLGKIAPVSISALSFNQLSDRQKQQLLAASYQHYQQTHLINPVRDFDTKVWAQVAFTDMIPEAPIVLFDGVRIVAYCLVYAADARAVEWGWMAGESLDSLLSLQHQQLAWLQSRYQTVHGEFDSTDSMAAATRKFWPFAASPVIRTYLKPLVAP
ncbi:hypothetical protein [Lacticaseibacillus brantae]|uniref:N-acetyltransferase domain-containing protein n=1 Tax=Lacticaseibacillus brantae DSM 23927 TaxID=1423727 RepID=A0A0R2AWB5_9LACO|nr:hypothetical protein [Lacticaseibacillus brantae]KRM71167.1 hypothetical protein FC34_GL001858 [Lacticaseibacillus brantae DSM 23927]